MSNNTRFECTLKCTAIPEDLPRFAVDDEYHMINLFLTHGTEVRPLGEVASDHFVCVFNPTLLP